MKKLKQPKDKISQKEWEETADLYLDDDIREIILKSSKKLGITYNELLQYLVKTQISRIHDFEALRRIGE